MGNFRIYFTKAIILACFLFLCGTLVYAQTNALLRSHIVVQGSVVTAGQLFENAGEFSDIALFKAPDLGKSGWVSARIVIQQARHKGMQNIEPGRIERVFVRRDSKPISSEDLHQLIQQAYREKMSLPDAEMDTINISLQQHFETRHADAHSKAPFWLRDFQLSADSGRFSSELVIDKGNTHLEIKVYGKITREISVFVLNRSLARDEIIVPGDITMKRLSRLHNNAHSLMRKEDLIGLAARRNLRAGIILRKRDFKKPVLVRRGEQVTIHYQVGALHLTAAGVALEDGAEGEVIRIRNNRSQNILQATAQANGIVQIAVPATLSSYKQREVLP